MLRLPFFASPPRLLVEPGSGDTLDADPACQRCKLHEGAKTVCIPPAAVDRGPVAPVLLVVGDSPGSTEDIVGKPFVGNTGKYMRPLIERAWQGTVIYDNAVRCYPGSTDLSATHVRECRAYLRMTMLDTQPARILALGSTAARSVLGIALAPFSTRRGFAHASDGTPVFFLIHPSSTFRNRFVRQWFEEDLAWALTAEPERARTDGGSRVITSEAEGKAAIESAREMVLDGDARFASIDAETYGAMGDSDFRVLTFGMSVGMDAYVWDESRLGLLRDNPAMRPFRRMLGDPAVPKTAHNAGFDWRAAYHGLGEQVRGIASCTRIFRKLVQADAHADLEAMQPLVGMGGWKELGDEAADLAGAAIQKQILFEDWLDTVPETLRSGEPSLLSTVQMKSWTRQQKAADKSYAEGWFGSREDFDNAVRRVRGAGHDIKQYRMAGIPPDVRIRYCGMDCVSQAALAEMLQAQVAAEPGLQMTWEEVHRPFHRAVEAMETTGVLIDKGAVEHLQLHMRDRIEDLTGELQQYGEVNINSPQQVAAMLQAQGVRLGRPGKSGVPSVSKDVLEKIKHPAASAIVELRRAVKFKGTYADAMQFFVRDDGRVHCTILIDGTETGRPSSSGPNMFNMPRPKNLDGKLCRDMITAPEGWWLLEIDQSQVEFREAAILSGDEVMLDMFAQGMDFHLATAKLIAPIFGVDPDAVDKDHILRDQAKTLNFATLYGDPVEGTAAKLGITVDAAKKLRAAILGKFKKLAKWIETQVREGRRTGFCRTYWRGEPALIRPLWQIGDSDDEARETAERSCYNTPVQGSAALITNATCGAVQAWIDEDMPPVRLVLTVYDSLLMEVMKGHLRLTLATVAAMSTQWHPLLEVDAKVGQSWGSMRGLTEADL